MQATKRVKNPGKQRKMLFNAPAHIRHKLMAAPLSPELLAQKGIKTLPVRKGDTVRVMRGDHKGFEGKISRIDLKRYRVYLEGLTREKVDGTAVFVGFHPSKVMIKNLNLDDKRRKAVLDRKKPIIKKKVEKKAPSTKVQEKKAAAKKEAAEVEEAFEKITPEAEVPEVTVVEEVPEVAVPEKLEEETPKAKAAKAVPTVKKPAAKKKKEEAEEPKPAAKKPAAKRKAPSETEGGT